MRGIVPTARSTSVSPRRRATRTRFVLAALLAAAACTSTPADRAAEPSAATPVRAMTFNIRYGTAPDGDHAWPLRRPLVYRVIREFDPTILGVQEALRFQLDEIGGEFEDYGEIGVGRDDGITRGEYSAILYDRRRLEPLAHGTFWLSDTPTVPGSMTWGNRYSRVATWARFRDRADNRSFYVFNTHWDHESQPARERSATLILERIRARAAPDDPVLLMGDFNAGEDNAAFTALLAGRGAAPGAGPFVDTFRARHPDARDVGTFHAFRGDRSGDKIDAILASPDWQILAADIVHLVVDNRYPSDHFPMTATLLLHPRRVP